MKASEFQVVAEARLAAERQLSFFNSMMAVKTAGSAAKKKAALVVAPKKRSGAKAK